MSNNKSNEGANIGGGLILFGGLAVGVYFFMKWAYAPKKKPQQEQEQELRDYNVRVAGDRSGYRYLSNC